MVIEVPITNSNLVAVVDDEDAWTLADTWYLHPDGYAYRRGDNAIVYMHREIMMPEELLVDHIDRNPLNNRRSNLRVVNKTGNALNQEAYRLDVIQRVDGSKRYRARLIVHGRFYTLGTLRSEWAAEWLVRINLKRYYDALPFVTFKRKSGRKPGPFKREYVEWW